MSAEVQVTQADADFASRWASDHHEHALIARDAARHRTTAEADSARLIAMAVEVIADMIPKNVCLTNPHWPDDTVLPVDVTLGELRKCAATLAALRAQAPADGEK